MSVDSTQVPEFQRSDSQEKKLQAEIERKTMDPIHMAVKSKKPMTASSSPMPLKMTYSNQNDEVVISGWLKIRGYMNVWWNRWCLVKEGKLVEYRNEKVNTNCCLLKLSERRLLCHCIISGM